ncbi:hypothetical protein PZ938_18110 [Luteipulveratus sp. YIM 133132]|uniref:DUF4157 domain-containing protein n=1 Tax=Luteipulveratus flavus TaxID=3031728 RepID=A0ABT6C4C4_9MICO|nr:MULTISPECIES: hypothetical protein [unclassified Luteipulveratus]MDE9367537.1 hypothetical protein [Luteipulveratus sp. YIM 133132]MDF8263398.1 hypothetical protein [Luteipulveratus sp. YIM 133296]
MTATLLPSERLTSGQRVRSALNWANGSTLFGLAVAALGHSRVRQGPRGLWLADRYAYGFPIAGAFTVGNVLITRHDWTVRVEQYPDLLAHEERHSWQYVWCGGLPFIPLYLAAMGWSALRTGDRAARNLFERHAGLASGGYVDAPVRTWSASVRALRPSVR